MCFNCADMIDMCAEDECGRPDGKGHTRGNRFYVGDEYCRHLREEYGHRYAEWADRYGEDA